jgi:cytochrome P450
VLKTNFDNFVKGDYVGGKLRDVLGHGIFAVDGELWKPIRKKASNIFSIRAFREFVETVFVNEMRLFSVELIACAKSNTPVDLQDLFFRFTLDSFGQVGFGVLKDNLGMLS